MLNFLLILNILSFSLIFLIPIVLFKISFNFTTMISILLQRLPQTIYSLRNSSFFCSFILTFFLHFSASSHQTLHTLSSIKCSILLCLSCRAIHLPKLRCRPFLPSFLLALPLVAHFHFSLPMQWPPIPHCKNVPQSEVDFTSPNRKPRHPKRPQLPQLKPALQLKELSTP